jgi:hypothetical protein
MGGIVTSLGNQIDKLKIRQFCKEFVDLHNLLNLENPSDEAQYDLIKLKDTNCIQFNHLDNPADHKMKANKLYEMIDMLRDENLIKNVQLYVADGNQFIQSIDKYKDDIYRHRITSSITLKQYDDALADIHERQYLQHTEKEYAFLLFLKAAVYEMKGDIVNLEIAKNQSHSALMNILNGSQLRNVVSSAVTQVYIYNSPKKRAAEY